MIRQTAPESANGVGTQIVPARREDGILQDEGEARTGAYWSVREDSSEPSARQNPAAVGSDRFPYLGQEASISLTA